MRKYFLFFILFSSVIGQAQEVSVRGNEFYLGENRIWFDGINSPWHSFNDFGNPSFDNAWWTTEFQKYAKNNINLARVWIHMSGEVSPEITADGYVTGVPADFWDNMDHLLRIAKENKVYVMPALFSFDITKDKYSTHQQYRSFIQSPAKIQSYINNVLIPLIKRYNDEKYLLAWEICNEPEWMFENEESGPQSWQDIQKFHAMIAAAIHKNSSKMVTTGSAAPKWNSPRFKSWGDAAGNLFSDEALSSAIDDDDAYLDFYQYHWYPWQTEHMGSPFTHTVDYYQVNDKPVIVGEAEGNDVCDEYLCQTVTEMYENAFLNGFDGVCAWKTPQNDGHGTFENISVATNAFHSNHPELVYPEFTVKLNDEQAYDEGFSVFPNPSTSEVAYISFSNNQFPYFIDVLNLNGTILEHFKTSQSEFALNLGGFKKGVYFIVVQSEKERMTQKLILQ